MLDKGRAGALPDHQTEGGCRYHGAFIQPGRNLGDEPSGNRQRDAAETLALCDELQKRLDPLGRARELLSAFADPDKLAALAEEFGLEA